MRWSDLTDIFQTGWNRQLETGHLYFLLSLFRSKGASYFPNLPTTFAYRKRSHIKRNQIIFQPLIFRGEKLPETNRKKPPENRPSQKENSIPQQKPPENRPSQKEISIPQQKPPENRPSQKEIGNPQQKPPENRPSQKEMIVFQPSIFRGFCC